MRIAWNKGKTKEDFPQLSNSGVKKGNIPWNKGKKYSLKHSSQFKVGIKPLTHKEDCNCFRCKPGAKRFDRTGMKTSKETKRKMSIAQKRTYKNGRVPWNKDKNLSKKHKEKIRNWVLNNKKKVIEGAIKGYLSQSQRKTTKPEKELKKNLDKLGIAHISQYPMYGKFVVDEFLPKVNTIIEVDGRYWHNLPRRKKLDKAKDAYLRKCGHKVIRLWEDKVSGFSMASL